MLTALSVIVGFVVWSIFWVGANTVVQAAFPDRFQTGGSTGDPTVLLIMLVLSVALSVLSGWLTAKTARAPTNRPAVYLGILLLMVGIAVQASFWDAMPLWYHVTFLLLLLPAAMLGGALVPPKVRTLGP